jgi:hypothetical protein
MNQVLLKNENYCQPIREIRRVFKILRLDNRAIDAISLILEYDSAYRYILQDAFNEFDKLKFFNDYKKELKRVFDIVISRTGGEDTNKFKNMYKLLVLATKIKGIREKILWFIEELRMEEVRPSKEDYYWMLMLKTYKCFGYEPKEADKIYEKLKSAANK